ncbi:MAG: LuxR C-terminal-related transcriptional regulator [Candidatus Sulfotelmatobacter sp.]
MRTSPALAAIDSSPDTRPLQVDEVIRRLVELLDKATSEMGLGPCTTTSPSEEVLVDLEVDGARYLLVRMPQPNGKRTELSPREQKIVRMVAKGHPNKVIADVLNISAWTVCTHLRRIFAKLGVGSRAAMVARLLEMGA